MVLDANKKSSLHIFVTGLINITKYIDNFFFYY